MAKARKRPLKGFEAQFGFYDTVVAAQSRAATLKAWGVHQNLFAVRQATFTHDAQAIRAALSHPAMPFRRVVGSSETYSLDPTGPPAVPDGLERRAGSNDKAEAKASKTPD